jgi:uncharacterized protein YbjT (DUF2867 family)
MNLIVGATGFLGGEICRRLRNEDRPVRALVRHTSDPARVAVLKALGVELVTGDLQDRASLDAACDGVHAVVTTAATTISRQPHDSIEATDLEGQKALVDAAVDAGADRFIYVSVASALGSDVHFLAVKRAVEEHVRRSGLTYTNLRPASFMEVWLGPALGFDVANARARVLDDGKTPHSWISLGDVAEYAARSLENPAAANQDIDLGGPAALTQLEVVQAFEDAIGRPFEVEHAPLEGLEAHRDMATDPYDQAIASLMVLMATTPCVVDMDDTARDFGFAPVSVADYAQRAMAPARA